MFSFFKKKVTPQADSHLTTIDPIRMTLDERKQWRGDMVRKSVSDAFASYNIVSGMYRCRITPVDERHHYFAVMIETTNHFAVSNHKTTYKLAKIEETIKKIAFNSYNIIVDGVYWKANETVEVFEGMKEYNLQSNRPPRSIGEIAQDFKHTIPGWTDSAYADRETSGTDGKEYDTDMSPLGPN